MNLCVSIILNYYLLLLVNIVYLYFFERRLVDRRWVQPQVVVGPCQIAPNSHVAGFRPFKDSQARKWEEVLQPVQPFMAVGNERCLKGQLRSSKVEITQTSHPQQRIKSLRPPTARLWDIAVTWTRREEGTFFICFFFWMLGVVSFGRGNQISLDNLSRL